MAMKWQSVKEKRGGRHALFLDGRHGDMAHGSRELNRRAPFPPSKPYRHREIAVYALPPECLAL